MLALFPSCLMLSVTNLKEKGKNENADELTAEGICPGVRVKRWEMGSLRGQKSDPLVPLEGCSRFTGKDTRLRDVNKFAQRCRTSK